MYTALTISVYCFLSVSPKKHFQERQRRGTIYRNGLKERYNNLEMFCWLCLNIKKKLFQRYSSYCIQLLNTTKLNSVFYIQYSQHKLKTVSRKSKLYKGKKAFMYEQQKYLKITSLVG